jgi:UDP-2-acetamido-3-amino-2,3-dideoxy-glucuronate N-acetyltransferase
MSDVSPEAFVHETAVVDEGASIGARTKVWHFVHVSKGARIGEGCVLGQNVYVGNDVPIGDGVRIQNNVSIYTGVVVEDEAFLGPSCVFTNVVNPRSFVERKDEYRRTVVGRGASVGANAVIVCGHDLGPYSFVGAGAVVTKNVRPHALVVGNPARQIGWICRCGERLPDSDAPSCAACGKSYRLEGESLSPVEKE